MYDAVQEFPIMDQQTGRASKWRTAVMWLAVALAVLEFVDAFRIRFPVFAIVFALLLLGGVVWLRRTAGKAPVLYAGALFLIELLLVLFAFGGMADLTNPEPTARFVMTLAVTVVSLVGTVAAIGVLAQARGGSSLA
jgi:hypothetical protein